MCLAKRTAGGQRSPGFVQGVRKDHFTKSASLPPEYVIWIRINENSLIWYSWGGSCSWNESFFKGLVLVGARISYVYWTTWALASKRLLWSQDGTTAVCLLSSASFSVFIKTYADNIPDYCWWGATRWIGGDRMKSHHMWRKRKHKRLSTAALCVCLFEQNTLLWSYFRKTTFIWSKVKIYPSHKEPWEDETSKFTFKLASAKVYDDCTSNRRVTMMTLRMFRRD